MTADAKPLLQVQNLSKNFGPARLPVRAVDDVSFEVWPGETLAVVGESGSGKSTIGRCLLRLIEPSSGRILWHDTDLVPLNPEAMRAMRRHMQIVFQDPQGSLDPRLNVRAIIAEPLDAFRAGAPAEKDSRVRELLGLVGLPADAIDSYPHELSGGQQRVGIARAMALNPGFVVCDEAVSALDLSVQAQILRLLEEVQARLNVSYLFISHNLGVVERIARRVMVLYLGRIVEIAPTGQLFGQPRHPYTQALLSAIPSLDPDAKTRRILLSGEMPSPTHPPSGCAFHPRCPLAIERCRTERPALRSLADGHRVACHLAT